MARVHASSAVYMSGPNKLPAVFLICLLTAQSVFSQDEISQCRSDGDFEQSESRGENAPTKEQNYRFLFAEAECLRQVASTAGAEWFKTGELLTRAKQEADAGRWGRATELVATARFQAIASIHQAEKESEAWKNRVVK